MSDPTDVINCNDFMLQQLHTLFSKYGLEIEKVSADEAIPGSFFGEREAGLIGNKLIVRSDTPVHSVLHEAGHYICMDPKRRANLHTDAEGDYDEENGVCYLQILLAGHIQQMGQARMLRDMDRWGYTFRLGSAKAWFEQDADDARQWLQRFSIIDSAQQPTWQVRST
ncbi:MAG: hypothetical protein CMH22_14785 [Methylophaga sp.]|uniref:hypothetical protein n=1 Tax=Methylophaga sp. UBA678 TaxID=1946901 RepID=UPI000C54B073|nr:hypothetical protein [Methylophaga sp. UBA678]MAX53240.1 hypothetical protein [Methylophaga sp.]